MKYKTSLWYKFKKAYVGQQIMFFAWALGAVYFYVTRESALALGCVAMFSLTFHEVFRH